MNIEPLFHLSLRSFCEYLVPTRGTLIEAKLAPATRREFHRHSDTGSERPAARALLLRCQNSLRPAIAALLLVPLSALQAAWAGAPEAGKPTDPASRGLPFILSNTDGTDLDAVAHWGEHPFYNNWHRTTCGAQEMPEPPAEIRSLEDFLALRLGPMAESGLLGVSNGVNWNDPVWEIKRDRLKALGDDPFKAIVDFWKMKPGRRYYLNMRMNDGHHQWINTPGLCTDFRKNNRHLYLNPPSEEEWQNEILPWINGKTTRDIAKVLSKGNPTDWQWDYAKPEVREHFLSVIREACRRYDAADGVELDFLRFPTFFKKGEVSVDTMTDFVGQIHEILKAASAGRKEPLRLLVRVPETPEKALAIGLDVEQWMRRDWVDALIAGNGFIFSDDPVTPWRGITRAHGVPLYGVIERTPAYSGRYFVRFGTPEGMRAAVATLLELGADGIYFFNYTVPQEMSLFAEIAEPVKLAALPKEYFVDCGWLSKLPAKLGAGEKVQVPLVIGEDPKNAGSMELEVVWDGSEKSMAPKLSLNGVHLAEFKERPTQHWPDMSDNPHSQEVPRDYRGRPDNRFTVALTDTETLRQTLKRGKNEVEIEAKEPSTVLSVSLRVVPSVK